ncbi:MAG: DUF1294 domain-containing protein [Paludibacteraceae bacterium]|jgi:uncharacterized membrane protein YsdA (DUF1294 family)|nr:DUF1294 domain-containing protein [Paludibacteraceae bacterium]MEE0911678.1 DUF1294 domain-containing protein [Paludibacteraceae bacterium]
MQIVIGYIIILNIVTFAVYGIDKIKAKKGAWRIPEKSLLLLAFIGGSLGAAAGMRFWRHKTLHPQFKWGVPLILLFHLALIAYLAKGTI